LGKEAPLLQSKKLFGEMPSLAGSSNKSPRLSDQIDTIKDTAFKQGFEAGFESGSQAGTAEGRKAGFQKAMTEVQVSRVAEVAQFMIDLDAFRTEFEQAANEWAARTEKIVTELSMEVVHKILATELEINHQVALGICKEVLQNVTHAKEARILINPKDYALFESHRDEIIKQSRELKSIEIVEDNSIRSGVMIETESGIIDATVETRLELIVNEFDQAA
jgi:flagellar biosynthesis/type III secretory pathway protein FliH